MNERCEFLYDVSCLRSVEDLKRFVAAGGNLLEARGLQNRTILHTLLQSENPEEYFDAILFLLQQEQVNLDGSALLLHNYIPMVAKCKNCNLDALREALEKKQLYTLVNYLK